MTTTVTDISRHRALADERRTRIVQELELSPDGLDAAELAQRLALHVNTVRWHLGILADAGVVGSRPEARTTPGRPRIRYHIAAGEEPRPRDSYRLLAQVLVGIVGGEEERCEAAGREWGRALAESRRGDDPLDAVLDLLDEQGFEPVADGDQVAMLRCPFHDLAEASPDVVCALHRGVIDGALAELGSPLAVAELDVFPTPDVCFARLAPRLQPVPSEEDS